jgi:hypothetical protein
MGLPGSTYRLIFEVWLRWQKIIIFGRITDVYKNKKNLALESNRVDLFDFVVHREGIQK